MRENDRYNIINATEDSVNVLIIALEDLNELQREFTAKDSLISIKELKSKGNDIKAIIGKFKDQLLTLPEQYRESLKNSEYICEGNIDDAIMGCILCEDSEHVGEIIHNMCYILREFAKKLDT